MGLEFPKPSPVEGYNPEFLKRVYERQRIERARRAEQEKRERLIAEAAEKAAAAAARIASGEQRPKRRDVERKIRSLTGAGPKFQRIVARLCRAFKAHPREVFSKRRNQHIVYARQAIYYWLARLTPFSLPYIGKMMGRDHTTVLYGKDAYVEKRRAQGRYLRPAR